MTALSQVHKAQLNHQLSKGLEFNLEADPCFLTDKDEVKIIPCRKCHCVCVCNRFAAMAKTECLLCRDGAHAPDQVHEFDRSKETHVLTDKEETKELPCRSCGRPCVCNQFAAPAKVACNSCRTSVPRPRKQTTIEHRSDGRHHEVTTIIDIPNQQWTIWTIECPMDIDRLWTDEEHTKHAELITARLEHNRIARSTKRARENYEYDLKLLVDNPPRDDKEYKEQKTSLEDKISEGDQLVIEQEDYAKRTREEADQLARIGFIRGALDMGYRLEQEDGHHVLRRGEQRTAHLPDDFLDVEGYSIATKGLAHV